jgi:sortase B
MKTDNNRNNNNNCTFFDSSEKYTASAILLWTLLMAFIAMALCLAFILLQRMQSDMEAVNKTEALSKEIVQPEITNESTAEPVPADNQEKYRKLVEKNRDFIGWLEIKEGNISLPVVWIRGDNSFYLTHGFDLKKDVHGTAFLDGRCDPDPASGCNNLVVYGHNMKTGTMFAPLLKYESQEYYEAHPEISFSTLRGDGNYEIFGAFAVDVTKDKDFQYYEDTAMDEKGFRNFISQVKKKSVISTGITPQYGDRILTLSTCEYSTEDGRFVVLAVEDNR